MRLKGNKYALLLGLGLLISCSGGSSSPSVSIPQNPTDNPTDNTPGGAKPGMDFSSSSENQQFVPGSSGFYSSDKYKVYGNSTFVSGGPISSENYRIQSSKFNVGQLGIQLQIGSTE